MLFPSVHLFVSHIILFDVRLKAIACLIYYHVRIFSVLLKVLKPPRSSLQKIILYLIFVALSLSAEIPRFCRVVRFFCIYPLYMHSLWLSFLWLRVFFTCRWRYISRLFFDRYILAFGTSTKVTLEICNFIFVISFFFLFLYTVDLLYNFTLTFFFLNLFFFFFYILLLYN